MNAKKSLRLPQASGGKLLHTPSTDASGSTNSESPTFCFRYASGLNGADHKVCYALAKMLRDLAQLSWQQIGCAPRKGMGHEKITRGQIKVPLHAYTGTLEHVLAFRLSDEWRLLGDRTGGVLRVLYAGPDAYDH